MVEITFAHMTEQEIAINPRVTPTSTAPIMIRLCMASVSDLSVVLMQDYLGLGSEGRMNFPGTRTDKNWTWRASPDFATDQLAERIRELTRTYGRI